MTLNCILAFPVSDVHIKLERFVTGGNDPRFFVKLFDFENEFD